MDEASKINHGIQNALACVSERFECKDMQIMAKRLLGAKLYR